MGSPESAADRDSASGLVSSLVITALFTALATWGAGSAVPDIQPASADCNRVSPSRPQPQQRRGAGNWMVGHVPAVSCMNRSSVLIMACTAALSMGESA